jgi:sulfite exporter TauE/SafE
MPLLIFLILIFVLFGWSLPSWAWSAVPMTIGALMLVGGLLGIVGSFRQSGATTGLGSVIVAFFGVVLVIFGLGMAGRGDVVEVCLGWLRNVDFGTIIIVSFILGFVLAAFANRQP